MQQVLEHQIRERAYHLWEANGQDGDAHTHWLAAEREVLSSKEISYEIGTPAAPAKRKKAPAKRKKA